MTRKTALITGGASGMGLAVATALSSHPTTSWTIHILDLNASAGQTALKTLKSAHFHQTNVTDYTSLASAFDTAFTISGRLDFVFANAGIVERDNFYATHDLDAGPPPEPNQLSVDVNLKAVVNTAYLALHYFRKTIASHRRESVDPVLVMTASCGALYPSEFCPMYSGAKAGVVHFNRAISVAYQHEGIRTFAVCPGTIKTGLMDEEEWMSFPEEYFTPVETLVDTVLELVDEGDMVDATGRRVGKLDKWGLTVEVNGKNFYVRDGLPFCDENMERMMAHTSMAKQLARLEKGRVEANGVNGL